MPWAKVDDKFPDHPKVLDIGPVAEALWLRGLCYANRNLTDGQVPFGFVRRMGDLDGPAEAAKLVAAGLWSEGDQIYRIHDYHDYQPTKADIDEVSRVRAEAGKRGGYQKAENDRLAKSQQTTSNVPSKPLANAKQNSSPNRTVAVTEPNRTLTGEIPPVGPPADEDPSDPPSEPTKPPKAIPRRIPDDWMPTDDDMDWATRTPVDDEDSALGLPSDFVRSETLRFIDYWIGCGKSKVNWTATWRGWMRREAQDGRPLTITANGRSPTPIRRLSKTEENQSKIRRAIEIAEGRA